MGHEVPLCFPRIAFRITRTYRDRAPVPPANQQPGVGRGAGPPANRRPFQQLGNRGTPSHSGLNPLRLGNGICCRTRPLRSSRSIPGYRLVAGTETPWVCREADPILLDYHHQYAGNRGGSLHAHRPGGRPHNGDRDLTGWPARLAMRAIADRALLLPDYGLAGNRGTVLKQLPAKQTRCSLWPPWWGIRGIDSPQRSGRAQRGGFSSKQLLARQTSCSPCSPW